MTETRRRKPFVLAGALVATVILCAILAWMIESRASILRDGTEVVLRSEPIDPRDLLRGRYVVLTYPAQAISGDLLQDARAQAGENRLGPISVYVTMEPGPDGFHRPVAASLDKPDTGTFIRGQTGSLGTGTNMLRVNYGIGRFYTNEHRAPELERRMREGALTEIVVAVDENGTAQIKALRQDGEVIVTEPLY